MRTPRLLPILIFGFLLPGFFGNLPAQQQVRGLVIDAATRETLPYVSIAVAGTTYGTVSNQNGEFSLNLDKLNPSDSITFHCLGYEYFGITRDGLKDGMTVRLKEKRIDLKSITIVAKQLSAEGLIKKAVERRAVNYPAMAQKREVFKRTNKAAYIQSFDISLKKSDIPEIDKKLVREMIDSIPRYTRWYEDYLYTLYSVPADSGKTRKKVIGIKDVVLKEDNGGGLENINKTIFDLFVQQKDDQTFWRYRTGPITFGEKNVRVVNQPPDSTYLKALPGLYVLPGDLTWDWDFIKKTSRYVYEKKGIIGIDGEDAWAISFKGKARGDYQGMIYISAGSYAILRIEYTQRVNKGKDIDLLGVTYQEEKDEGLVLYEKDPSGYYLKYAMHNTSTRYGVDRPFEIMRKEKRPVLNKKLNEASFRLNLQGRQEACYETLVVMREKSSAEAFKKIQEKGVKPDKISAYSDAIWKGYSIIEPTRQMKEYKAATGKIEQFAPIGRTPNRGRK